MRYLLTLTACVLLTVFIGQAIPTQGQDGSGYQWPVPLNSGEMPTNANLLPPSQAMPKLPLPETLITGTLFFNAESFGAEYRIENLTLDRRLYAYNITTEIGVLPISPNGQYGITTKSAYVPGPVTCGIIDLLTNIQVDEFQTDGACSGVAWAPDSKRLLFTTSTEDGFQSLVLRQNGANTVFNPIPAPESDLGGAVMAGDAIYIIGGWISNTTFTFDIGLQGVLSEQLFVSVDNLETAVPAVSLKAEQSASQLLLWRPAQPLGALFRGLWLTNFETGDVFELAPAGHDAIYGDVSPDGRLIAYWAATESNVGPVHPLRLVIYNPATDEQIVLLQFDGPTDLLATRPGLIVWNPEGIYFHISQQSEASQLETGAYQIQPDGSNLQYITPYLLMGALDN